MPAALVTAGFRSFGVMIDARDNTAGAANFAKIDAAQGAHNLTFPEYLPSRLRKV